MGSEVIDQRALTAPTMFLSHEDQQLETSCVDDLLTALQPTPQGLPPATCHLDCLTPRVRSRGIHPARLPVQPSPSLSALLCSASKQGSAPATVKSAGQG